MANRKKPRHNYSEDTKKLCLAQTELRKKRKQKQKPTPYTYCKNEETPDASTVYRWKREEAAPSRDPASLPPRGRPPKLSRMEQLVVGGWVLHRVKAHKQTSINAIQKFIATNFNEDVSIGWVSTHMQALHLSSHQAANRPSKYKRPQLPQELYRFLKALRSKIDELGDPSRVVAVDTVRFTHPEYVLRTYAPEGGYVVPVLENLATVMHM